MTHKQTKQGKSHPNSHAIVRDTPSCSIEQYKLGRHIHDSIPEPKESLGSERLGKHVSHIMLRSNKRYTQLVRFHFLADKKVSPLNMLNPGVMLRVISCGDSRLVIDCKWHGRRGTEPKFAEEALETDGFLSGL